MSIKGPRGVLRVVNSNDTTFLIQTSCLSLHARNHHSLGSFHSISGCEDMVNRSIDHSGMEEQSEDDAFP